MTIFELLDLLETEMAALRVRLGELQLASTEESRTTPAEKKKKARRSTSKSSKGRRQAASSKLSRQVINGEQMALPVPQDEHKEEQPARLLGKRQALGKSLLQLRKVAAPRPL